MNKKECIEVLKGIKDNCYKKIEDRIELSKKSYETIAQAIKWGEEVETLRTQLAEANERISRVEEKNEKAYELNKTLESQLAERDKQGDSPKEADEI